MVSGGARPALVVNAAVVATVSTVLPGFLIGALSVQVTADIPVSAAVYGWGLGSFFGAAMVGSILLGRLAQRFGALRMMTGALALSAAVQLTLAAAATSFAAVVGLLVVAGLCNAANQTSVNLALAEARLSRLGLAVSIKQSGMPTATLLAGFAVPSLAVTVGWRWAYVASAAFALASLAVVRAAVGSSPQITSTRASKPDSSPSELVMAALVGALLAFGAGSLNAWGVSSGVDAGLGEGVAGLFLSLGAAVGITLRLISGWLSDTMRARPFFVGGVTAIAGAVGMVGLSLRSPSVHVAALLLALGGGWIWPVFTNFGIVRANPTAAGAATGITQMGIYVGVFVGPLITGWLIENSGYQAMWLVVAAASLVGALVSIRVADHF